jgi:hypothetical protein
MEPTYDPFHEKPAPDPVAGEPKPFFSPHDLERLHEIQRSTTWRILATGMRELRESLLNSHPTTDAALNQTWGRIMQLSDLLQGGPMLVLNAAKLGEQRGSDGVDEVAIHTYEGE